jgi:ribonuclease P protein component
MAAYCLTMLAKINRLTKKKDLERVFKKGRGFKEDFLILKTIKNDLKVSRFGFIVSQKISKKATIRNKIKRRLRELVRGKLKKMKTSRDNLIIALPGLEKKDFWEIEETTTKLFKRAKLI